MNLQQYKLVNNIAGWLIFAFALFVYATTMESSVSFWDCGEFIAGAYKLEVVHPPGAPFFLMLGRIFTFFCFGNPELVPLCINFLSASSTAFAVLFCFWSTTILAGKIVFKGKDYSMENVVAVVGTGAVGAFACTFVDSLWFSATEGEVYALSIFFMTFVFWAALKWEGLTGPKADRWLILIAYVIGLSVGVHLLSLLAIPVIGVIYYYKNYKPNLIGLGIAFVASFILLFVVIMKMIISGVPAILAFSDRIFVNDFGMGFGSGAIFCMILMTLLLAAAIFYTQKKRLVGWNKIILALSFFMIGYSSYIMVPIRANANPPINMNKPADPYTMLSYVNREQYGDRPLAFGPDYTADQYDLAEVKETGNKWRKIGDRYEVIGQNREYIWKDNVENIFPRMGFWQEKKHENAYRAWMQPDILVYDRGTNKPVKKYQYFQLEAAKEYIKQLNAESRPGRYDLKDDISFSDNLSYFFNYQLGYMYMRYFLWNFSGRLNDTQGLYSNDEGGWVVGIPAIDDALTAWGNPDRSLKNLPTIEANNFAYNKFYMLPLIFGLIGLIYSGLKNNRVFAIIGLLFLITGVIQLVYHNQPPIEPRERDYVLAASFYAYAMWIGFAVLALYDWLKKVLPAKASLGIAIALVSIAPILMGSQGWDDHDRSGRYTARDFAVNYLESCQPNAILFTQGDNDTYPLWYAQEVEGIRTDIRIINLSLLGVDWYIDQLHYKMNGADAVKLSFTQDQLNASNRDVTNYKKTNRIDPKAYYEMSEVMKFIASNRKEDKTTFQGRDLDNYLPTKKLKITVDSLAAERLNMLADADKSQLVDEMRIDVRGNRLLKNDLLTYDIVASNIWDRPIYFAVSVAPSAHMGFDKYFQMEGLTYRIVPKVGAAAGAQAAPIRTDVMYDNMMNKFRWGKVNEEGNFLDENILRMTMNMKGNFVRLAQTLRREGQCDKAIAALDECNMQMPNSTVPFNYFNLNMPEIYYRCEQPEKAEEVSAILVDIATDNLVYYAANYKDMVTDARVSGDRATMKWIKQGGYLNSNNAVRESLVILQQIENVERTYGDATKADEVKAMFDEYNQAFRTL